MWLLIIEALIALGMLLFIVWWTMFAGRPKGEQRTGEQRTGDQKTAEKNKPDDPMS
jgi:hypothetical protein